MRLRLGELPTRARACKWNNHTRNHCECGLTETDKHVFTECEHYKDFRTELLAETAGLPRSEQPETDQERIWKLIMMEEAEKTLSNAKKESKS